MDVDQLAGIVADKQRRENAHETGQDHRAGLVTVQGGDHCLVECFPAVVLAMIQYFGGNAGMLGTAQATGIGTVGQYHCDLCIQAATINGRHDGLQIGT
jgi:hypothetical protein